METKALELERSAMETSTSTSHRGRRRMMNDAGEGDGDGGGGGEIAGPSKSNLQEFESEEKEILTEKELKEKEIWGKDMREIEKEMEIEIEKILLVKQTEMLEKEKEMLFKMMIKEKKKGTLKNMWKKLKEKGTGNKKKKKKGIWEDLEMWWMKQLWEKEKEEMLVKDKREKEKEMRKEMRKKEPESLLDREMRTAKCLCLLGRGPEGKKGPVLYLFNLLDERASTTGEDKEDEDGKRQRQRRMQVITPAESIRRPEYFNTSVVVGSVIYVLGGMLEDPENEQEDPENDQELSFHNQVFLFDTNHPKKGWIKGPDMLNGRCSCNAVAVESKIYVFGGNNKTTRPWAEFLDPEKNKWEPLPALPDDRLMHDLLYNPVVYGGPGEGKKIILSCRRYIYHVDAQTWEEFRPPEEMRNFSCNLTSVGNILYWTTFGNLFSFDMKTRDVDFGLVKGYKLAKYEEQFLTEPTLLHLEGDYFCFITPKDLPEGRTQVRCSEFQVSREGWFKASVVCCNTCIIDCPVDIDWSNAFVLNGKLGAENSEAFSTPRYQQNKPNF